MKPDVSLLGKINWYLLLFELEGLLLYRRNKLFFFFFSSLVVNVKDLFESIFLFDLKKSC